MLSTVRTLNVIHTAAPDRGKLVTLITGKRRRLLFAVDGRRSVYDKKPESYAEDNRTEFNGNLVVNLKLQYNNKTLFYVVFVLFVFSASLLLTHYGQPALMSKFAFLAAGHACTLIV